MKRTISVLSLLFVSPLLAADAPTPADFVVATNGSDANPGTADKPFATLARARDAVRKPNAEGPAKEMLTVWVRGGTYALRDTLPFGPDDSAAPKQRIVYAAYPGEQPILSGGREITGWKRGEGKRWTAEVPATAETNQERIEGNVVWDCNSPKIDYEYGGPNNNKWVDNVLSTVKAEPTEARRLRAVIAAKRKKGLNPSDVEPVADERPAYMIGYTVQRTDLTGYYPNRSTGRAYVIHGDGSGATELAPELVTKPHQFTQFAGWSPDGRQAILYQQWESLENGAWEDKHGVWRHSAEHCLVDSILLDMKTKKTTNLTAVERVSFYNVSVQFWPEKKYSFSAMIGGELRPYRMDRDGKNKKPVPAGPGFIYGALPSPDGKRICYHRNYRLYLADADGSNANPVKDDHPFHFLPQWSPTGEWLEYLSGEHYNCHPHLIRPDGTGLRKLADRGGYRGVFQPIDKGTDGHSERSDPPTWSPDGKWLYYTAKVGQAVELMRVSPDGRKEQLTHSKAGVFNYVPQVSPDSKWVIFGSTRSGTRQLHIARADGSGEYPLTKVKPGWGALFPMWRPK